METYICWLKKYLRASDDDVLLNKILQRVYQEKQEKYVTENKFTTSQSSHKVTIQLQADMILSTTKQLLEIVREHPAKANSIKSLTFYGITFGVSVAHPLIVLKMTIDFEKNELTYYVEACKKGVVTEL